MFSVYGTTGKLFQGRMEQMPRLGPVEPIARVSGVEPVTSGAARALGLDDTPEAAGHALDQAHRMALLAYSRAAHPGTERHPLTRVSALMTRSVLSIDHGRSLLQAWQFLQQQGVGQAPVVNASGVVVGMLSRAELFASDRLPVDPGSIMAWQIMLAQPVTLSMRTPVPCVMPETDIRRVARVLLDTGLAGLPVVDDDGRVHAFVSRSDILRAVVTEPPLDLWG